MEPTALALPKRVCGRVGTYFYGAYHCRIAACKPLQAQNERGNLFLWSLPLQDCGLQAQNWRADGWEPSFVELTLVGLWLLNLELAHTRARTYFCGALRCRIAASKPRTGVREGGNLLLWGLPL